MKDIIINDTNTDKVGSIQISEEVLSVIAGTACFEIEEVVGMSSSTGFIEAISKKSLVKGVEIEMLEKGIEINVNVVLKLGSKISNVAEKVQEKVKLDIESMTNLTVAKVNVNITDLKEI